MKQSLSLSITYQHEIHTNQCKKFDRVFLLLHGYSLDGEFMFKKLSQHLPANSLIIAPNGPFFIPIKNKHDDQYLARFAWYFFDPYKKSFYINYVPAAQYLQNVLEFYNPKKLPVTVIGYSQGGYLAPKLAELEKSVDSIIGIACVFRNDRFQYRSEVQYHQIHGIDDGIVEHTGAHEEFLTLQARGNTGDFISLNDVGHRLQMEHIESLKHIIQEKI